MQSPAWLEAVVRLLGAVPQQAAVLSMLCTLMVLLWPSSSKFDSLTRTALQMRLHMSQAQRGSIQASMIALCILVLLPGLCISVTVSTRLPRFLL